MPKQEDAHLILKLYDLRREEKMRAARTWFFQDFHPQSVQDVIDTTRGEHSAHLRMVTSYWDMAAALVNHGAIDVEMFTDANLEHVAIYAKMAPFLNELRTTMGVPRLMKSLETLIQNTPQGAEMVAQWQQRLQAQAAAAQR